MLSSSKMCIRDSHEADGAVKVKIYFQRVHQMEYGYVMLAEMEVAEGVFKLRRICEQALKKFYIF